MADKSYEGAARAYRKQGATAFVIASGGALEVEPGGTLNVASGALNLPPNLKKGFFAFDLPAARALASAENFIDANFSATGVSVGSSVGGLLHAGSTPKLVMLSSANQMTLVQWASGSVVGIRLPTFVKPPDFDSSSPVKIKLLGRCATASGNAGFSIKVWDSTNTTNVGSTCASFTASGSVFTSHSITVSATGLTAYPGVLNVTLVPGAHQNDTIDLSACWLEYTRKTS